MKKKINLSLLFSLSIISIPAFSKNNVIYKKDIYIRNSYNQDCSFSKIQNNINALHLSFPYKDSSFNQVKIFKDSKEIYSFSLDYKNHLIKYPNLFSKDFHYETFFIDDNEGRFFFYPNEFPSLKNDLDNNEYITFTATFYNKLKSYSVDYRIDSYKFKNFSLSSFPKISIVKDENQVKVFPLSSFNDYTIMEQHKINSQSYIEKSFQCKKEKCKNLPAQFNIENDFSYLGFLSHLRKYDTTYEYKEELFSNDFEKKCYLLIDDSNPSEEK